MTRSLPPPTVIVSGIGRSGTKYVATVLNHCGLRATHEGVFKGGAPAAAPTREQLDALGVNVEVSGFAMGHLCERAFRSLPVVQVVRHPLDWLGSWQEKRFALDYINRHLGTSYARSTQPPLLRDVLASTTPGLSEQLAIWTQWNLAVAERAVFFFQVEHMTQADVEAIAKLGGVWPKLDLDRIARRMFQVPRTIHSAGGARRAYHWGQLDVDGDAAIGAAYQLSRRFGYR